MDGLEWTQKVRRREAHARESNVKRQHKRRSSSIRILMLMLLLSASPLRLAPTLYLFVSLLPVLSLALALSPLLLFSPPISPTVGIKLRPSTGLEASDYLVATFWIWAKIIENFADIGYDSNSMFMAPYDCEC